MYIYVYACICMYNNLVYLVMRIRKASTIFIPSRRRIVFLQKNIRQLNVELIERNVFDHRLKNKTCLSKNGVSDAKRKTDAIICGQDHKKKQPTANEHVETVFRFKVCFFLLSSIAVPLVKASLSSSRFDFAITKIL